MCCSRMYSLGNHNRCQTAVKPVPAARERGWSPTARERDAALPGMLLCGCGQVPPASVPSCSLPVMRIAHSFKDLKGEPRLVFSLFFL